MKVDRKKRPISTLNPEERKAMVEQLLGVWNDHPRWGLGQLIAKAASIPHGTRVSVEKAPDSDILVGLEAMIPMAWAVEEMGAREIEVEEIVDLAEIADIRADV